MISLLTGTHTSGDAQNPYRRASSQGPLLPARATGLKKRAEWRRSVIRWTLNSIARCAENGNSRRSREPEARASCPQCQRQDRSAWFSLARSQGAAITLNKGDWPRPSTRGGDLSARRAEAILRGLQSGSAIHLSGLALHQASLSGKWRRRPHANRSNVMTKAHRIASPPIPSPHVERDPSPGGKQT